MNRADWIAVDWGTSRVRAWAMSASGHVLDRAESDQGMSGLTSDGYEPALLSLVEPWLSVEGKRTVISCGMVGSRQGWVEAGYGTVPCHPAAKLTMAPVSSNRIAVWICSGLKQEDPPDVMRGEETQMAGLLAEQPAFAGVVCLPGTHSKWAWIRGGEICRFQTFMTGELHGLLAGHSVLRHTIAKEGWDETAYLEALNIGIADPASIASRLFSIRAEALLRGLDGSIARSRLSGYLIGMELAAARQFWRGQNIVLIGAPELSAAYATALRAQGEEVRVFDAEAMTLAGLRGAVETLGF